jgi:4-aminobutyrate aminotransferase
MAHQTNDLPHIHTPLPGPKTAALIERDKALISPSYTRGYPLSIASGHGAVVVDLDGNQFLDFCAGIAVCSTGHSHPEVVQVIQEQAAKFLHMSGTDFYYEGMVDLAEKLAKSAPGESPRRVFFGNSGAEANEGAIKLARFATGRQHFISFFRAFHGRTMGALALAGSKVIQKKHFAPLVPGTILAHYPYPYRDIFESPSPEACAQACLDYIENIVFKQAVSPDEVAAFVVEPIQGEGGYIVPPPEFLLGLQAIARKHGILIITDEVQSGIGRTGKMWASDHVKGFEPDIITSAKGLASGLPLGAVIARKDIMTWPPGSHASTFGGNPVACAAAIKTLELVETSLAQNAAVQGERLISALRKLQEQYPIIGDVRGEGLMVGVEIVKNPLTKEKAGDWRDAIVDHCFEQGLLILGCGESSIRLCPPLVIQPHQVDCAVSIMESVIRQYCQ